MASQNEKQDYLWEEPKFSTRTYIELNIMILAYMEMQSCK